MVSVIRMMPGSSGSWGRGGGGTVLSIIDRLGGGYYIEYRSNGSQQHRQGRNGEGGGEGNV